MGFYNDSWSSQGGEPFEEPAPSSDVENTGYTHDNNGSIADTDHQYTNLSHSHGAYTSEPPNLSGQRANLFSTSSTTPYSPQSQTNANYSPTQEDIQTGATYGPYSYPLGGLGCQSTLWQSTTQLPHCTTPNHPRWPSRLEQVDSATSLSANIYHPAYTSHGVLAPAIALNTSFGGELSNTTPAAFLSSDSGGGYEQGSAFPQPDAIHPSMYTDSESMHFNQAELSSTAIVSEYPFPNIQLHHNDVSALQHTFQEGRYITDVCRDCGRDFSGTAADVRHNLKRHQRHSCPEGEPEPAFQCRSQGCNNSYKRDDNRREHERKFHSNEGLPPPSKTR